MSEDNREELGRLIREQLSLNGWSTAQAAGRSESIDLRTFHNWMKGVNKPLRKVHAELEKLLGWEPGSVHRILEAPITAVPTLAEVRDWSKVEGSRLTQVRPAQIPTPDLLMELGARFTEQQKRIEALESELSEAGSSGVVSTPAQDGVKDSNVRHLYGLAAHNTDAGRNTEHLEGDGE